MTRPIPVFSFAFAAYTFAMRAAEAPYASDPADPPFTGQDLQGGTASSAQPGWLGASNLSDLVVKVAAPSASANRAGMHRSRAPTRFVWLENVVKTARGFSGIVAYASAGGADIGSRVHFARDAVRDWKLRGVGDVAVVKFSRSAFAKTKDDELPRAKTNDER